MRSHTFRDVQSEWHLNSHPYWKLYRTTYYCDWGDQGSPLKTFFETQFDCHQAKPATCSPTVIFQLVTKSNFKKCQTANWRRNTSNSESLQTQAFWSLPSFCDNVLSFAIRLEYFVRCTICLRCTGETINTSVAGRVISVAVATLPIVQIAQLKPSNL